MFSKTLTCMLFSLGFIQVVFAGDMRIDYSYAGLTSVRVDEKDRLHFAWHTRRLHSSDASPLLALRQSLDEYDSHTAIIWLTKTEVARLEQWITQNTILDLKSEYPEPEIKTYGSAFQSSLKVEFGGKKHTLSWSGDTKVPDSLPKAIIELVQICHEIRKSRVEK